MMKEVKNWVKALEYHLVFELPYDLVQEFKGVEHLQDTRKFVFQRSCNLWLK
jgi:hypothetical protein